MPKGLQMFCLKRLFLKANTGFFEDQTAKMDEIDWEIIDSSAPLNNGWIDARFGSAASEYQNNDEYG
jgi:hypothetical protein